MMINSMMIKLKIATKMTMIASALISFSERKSGSLLGAAVDEANQFELSLASSRPNGLNSSNVPDTKSGRY